MGTKFRSFSAVAREMRAGPDGYRRVKHLHLKNQVAKLDKGHKSWWAERTDAVARLAQVLGARPSDFRGPEARPPGPGAFAISEWPGLRDIDLHRLDIVLELGLVSTPLGSRLANLFGDLQGGAPVWVHLPRGAGRSLIVAHHRARRARGEPVEGASVERLAEAVALRDSLPESEVLVVELADFDPMRDGEALSAAAGCRSLWVLSPVPLPEREDEACDAPWVQYAWSPPATWKTSLLRWIEKRSPQEHPWPRLHALLHSVDALRDLPFTPRDVLQLARAWVGKACDNGACLERAARQLVEDAGASARLSAAERAWVAACAWRALERALRERWDDWRLPWSGALPAETWARLVPAELASPGGQGRGAEPLAANGATTVLLLRRSGLLVSDGGGQLRCASALLEEAIGRKSVAVAIGRDRDRAGLAALGRQGLGKARRPLLDQELSSLRGEELITLVDQLHAQSRGATASEDLGLRSLADALFLTIGWRLGDGWKPLPAHRGALTRLFQAVWPSLLRLWEERCPSLATRPSPWDGTEAGLPDEGNRFVAACWGWGYWLGRAPLEIEPSDSWLLPGLVERARLPARIMTPPGWSPGSQEVPQTPPWPGFERILAWSQRVLQRADIGPAVAGRDQRTALLGPLLVECALRDEPFPLAPLWPSLEAVGWSGRWADDLHHRLEAAAADDRPRLANYLLQHASHDGQGRSDRPPLLQRLHRLRHCGPAGAWVRDNLRIERLAECRERCGLWAELGDEELVELLHWVTDEQASVLLDWIAAEAAAKDPGLLLLARAELWRSGPRLVQAARCFPKLAGPAYRRLWELDSGAAAATGERLFASADSEDQALARSFVANIPLRHADQAATLLRGLPAAGRPEWTPIWAHRVISEGGPGVEEAWKLLGTTRA